MSSTDDNQQRVAEGPLGKAIGVAKAAAGAVLGDDQLRREGNLQQAAVDAAREADGATEAAEQAEAEARAEAERVATVEERDRLRAQVVAEDRDAEIEAAEASAEEKIDADAKISAAEAELQGKRQDAAIDSTEEAIDRRRAAERAAAGELDAQADRADQVAEALDPEEVR